MQSTLFGPEPQKAKPIRIVPSRGMVLIRQLAKDRGLNPRTLKGQLKRLNAKLGGTLLEKPTERGQYLVRLDVLAKHYPELVTPQVEEDSSPNAEPVSLRHIAQQLAELRDMVADLSDGMRQVRDMMAMLGT